MVWLSKFLPKTEILMNQKNLFDSNSQQLANSETFNPRNGSTFCDYNHCFKSYDKVRKTNGLRNILHLLEQSVVPLRKQKLLEGGFGTGVHIDHLRHRVQKIYGIEASDEGYLQALQKLREAKNVNLQVGNILQLPFCDEYFHAYMVNQVLHHLDVDPAFPNLNVFLSEARRVLVTGGLLTINTCSQEQLDPESGAYWHYKYIKAAVQALRERYIPIKELVLRLEMAGFTKIRYTIPSDQIFHTRYYEDPLTVLETGFRKGDSTYCLLSAADIEKSNARILAAIEDESVYKGMRRAAARAAEIGEVVIISARKVI